MPHCHMEYLRCENEGSPYCKRCGWMPGEKRFRKLLIRAGKMVKNADGLWCLVLKCGGLGR